MTDEDLERMEMRVLGEPNGMLVQMLVAEVRRLRGLIKEAEAQGAEPHSVRANCPWCGYAVGNWKRCHAPECPAFTESGDVR